MAVYAALFFTCVFFCVGVMLKDVYEFGLFFGFFGSGACFRA